MPGKLGCMGRGVRGSNGRWLERRESWRIGDDLEEWDGGREEGWMWEQGGVHLNYGSHFGVCKRLDSGGGPRPKERFPDCSLSSRGEGA